MVDPNSGEVKSADTVSTSDATADAADRLMVADIEWQSFVRDPELTRLIEQALTHNRDLRVAALNVEKARALYRIQRTALLPTVGLSASETAERTPASISQSGVSSTSQTYSIGVGISTYELDFFGRVRSLRDQMLQEYFASEEAQRTAYLSLISEVTANYVNWVGDREQLRLADETVKTREESYRLMQRQKQLGVTTELAVRQAQGALEAARVQAQRYKALVQTDRNALELLIGTPLPADLRPSGNLTELVMSQDVPAGLPSDLLQNRPDILAAEHHLQAMNASIGAARAAFFPRITLTAAAGLISPDLSDLFGGGTGFWNFVPQLQLPIFTGGQLTANLEMAEADQKIALAQYERAIQSAFREVADALVNRGALLEQIETLQRQTETAEIALNLVNKQYKAGVVSYLEVLDAQRSLYGAQQGLLSTQVAYQLSLVNVYKALGGGGNAVKEVLLNTNTQSELQTGLAR